jgi:hypothetical protein
VHLFDEEICWTPPTLWQGRLFVRSPSRAVCLWVGKGEELSPDTPTLATPPPSWHLDPAWLVSREREYPNDAPTPAEMTTWFLASLALLALAGLIALPFPDRGIVFLSLALVLPLFGPNLLSTALDRQLFTWPATLYAAFHGMLAITYRARQTGAAWRARLTVVCFLLVCYTYFEACRAVGLFLAWAFLAGFLPAFPLTWLAVRAAGRRRWLWATGWTLLAFVVFFWSGQGLVWWKGA